MILSEQWERILVVDDSPDAREVLSRTLGSEGYRVITAPGVAEAVRMLDDAPDDAPVETREGGLFNHREEVHP